jgi:hypothetical protein
MRWAARDEAGEQVRDGAKALRRELDHHRLHVRGGDPERLAGLGHALLHDRPVQLGALQQLRVHGA